MKKYFAYSLLILLHLVFNKAACQIKEEFDNMIYFIPAGLVSNKTDNSLLMNDASLGSGQYFTITIYKSSMSLKKIEKSFPVFWRESLLMDGVDNPEAEPAFVKAQTNSGWNWFRGGKPVQYNAQAPAFYYHLTVLKYLGITLRIITRASSEDIFLQKYPLLTQVVSSVSFKTQPLSQNNYQTVSTNPTYPAPQTNSGNTISNSTVQISGLYLSVQGDLLSTAELSVLHFSPDGTVYTDIPEKGFFNLNIQEQRAKFPSLFGSYITMNNTISVKMNNQPNSASYTIEPGGTIRASANPAQLFKKIESLDNYLFEGTYINRQSGSAKGIVFYKDGRFTDNSLIKTILSQGNEAFSEGSGSYSCRQNSILLQYSDGRQLQLCFYMMPEDFRNAGRPDKILINNYLLLRQ